MFESVFSWTELAAQGADAVTYFVMAMVATLLFLLRLGMALFAGGDADFDADADVGTDSTFSLFSILSILAFFMGAGWMGLAARLEWGLGRVVSAFAATGFGLLMMFLASGLMFGMRKLNREIAYDPSTAIGHTGRAYLTLPAKGEGAGQVEVTVSGRKKVLRAVSNKSEIQAFTDVKVVEVRDDGTLVVEPLD